MRRCFVVVLGLVIFGSGCQTTSDPPVNSLAASKGAFGSADITLNR